MVSSSDSPLAVEDAAMFEVDHVGRQALGGDLEGGAGARRVLEEQVEHALAAQQRHLLHFAVADADERCGGVEDVRNDLARQAFDRQQVMQLAVLVELRVAG